MNFDKPFWRTVLREPDGTASSSRLLTAAIVLATICWVTFVVARAKALPDLKPVGEFVSGIALSLYGVNKLTSTFNKPDPAPQ